MYIDSFDTLIYGDDGESPIRKTLVQMLENAAAEKARLRVDVRSMAMGTETTRSEHTFECDPADANADGLMRVLVDRLNASPGEGYLGQIRINFSAAGSSSRYGSWTRSIQPPTMSTGRISLRAQREEEEGQEDDNGENFDRGSRSRGQQLDPQTMMALGERQDGIFLDGDRARAWLDSAHNHMFRMNAQMMSMFDRSLRMTESYTTRFGFPTNEPGIVETRGGESAPGGPGPAMNGLMPALLQMAMKFANADSPAAPAAAPVPQIPERPARSESRALAIRGSGDMVRTLRPKPKLQKRPAPGYEPAPEVEEDGQWSADSGQGADEENYDESQDEAQDEGQDEGDFENEDQGPGGPPDLNGLSPEEMKEVFITWMRADPSRKAAVMGMLPDLSREIT